MLYTTCVIIHLEYIGSLLYAEQISVGLYRWPSVRKAETYASCVWALTVLTLEIRRERQTNGQTPDRCLTLSAVRVITYSER